MYTTLTTSQVKRLNHHGLTIATYARGVLLVMLISNILYSCVLRMDHHCRMYPVLHFNNLTYFFSVGE